jgi:hypothetical protein
VSGLWVGWDVCLVSGCAVLLWNFVTPGSTINGMGSSANVEFTILLLENVLNRLKSQP